MKHLHQIRCTVCSSDHHTAAKNTTHCNVCRAVRDFTFIGSKTFNCFGCQAKYAPVNRNDELCSNCDYHHAIYGKGTCAFCKSSDTALMRHDIAVCIGCMRDPALRSKVLMSLRKKQQQLIESPVRLAPPGAPAAQPADAVAV